LIISGDPLPQGPTATGQIEPETTADLESELETDLEAGLGTKAEHRMFEIPAALHGQRLDQALVKLVPEFSRSYLQQLIEAGFVALDSKAATKPAARVKAGVAGSIELRPTPQSEAFKPESIDIPIVFKDEHLLVINKPAGLVVHPAPGNWSGTLLNGLLALDRTASSLPRAGIVHRLDKNTSGLMVVARSREVMDGLVKMIASREVSRQYLALTNRPWPGAKVRDVDAPIGRDPRNRLRMAVVDMGLSAGKTAKTTFELLQGSPQGRLVKCTLHTGRTHQIRVHMAFIGCPLIDDVLYGGTENANPGRQALHASRLAFIHPITSKPLAFHAALPADLTLLAASMGLRYNES
jgi:23S rRNA pseudouridine1911/1915/1917 synthase